ncbi:MAG: AbrB/MazE/SpoVT family DNA-binding domain-containing protein [Terriglobales bacterium]
MGIKIKVSEKGQVVLPAELRKKLNIKKGTELDAEEYGGRLILQPVTDEYIRSIRGMLGDVSDILGQLRADRQMDETD